MNHWWPTSRPSKGDLDVMTEVNLMSSKPSAFNIESHWTPVSQEMIDFNIDQNFLDPDLLLTLKISHAQWDIHWEKTILDVDFMIKNGAQVHQEFHDRLVQHWATIHYNKKISMDKSNEEFFTDAVHRKIDHDELHKLVAFNEVPMHEKIRLDPNSPLCNKNLFEGLSQIEREQCAAEEIMVIALERYIPDSRNSSVRIGLSKARKQLVTRMTKGWFCQFLVENGTKIVHSKDVVDRTRQIYQNFY